MILTKYSVNLYETCFSLTGKQGKPVRVFGFALACWGFPNPFFTLRVATRFCETLKCPSGIFLKNEKEPEPDTDKSGI